MSHLRLSPSATITKAEGAVVLRSDLGAFSISGADLRAFLDRIVPLLDGTRDRGAIESALPAYSPKSVGAFLDVLEKHGLVDAAPEGETRFRGQEEFLRRCGAKTALASLRVALAGGEAHGVYAAMSLAAAGLGAIDLIDGDSMLAASIIDASPWCRAEVRGLGALSRDPPALLIAAIDPADITEMEWLSRAAHDAGVRSLWAHRVGAKSMLGPLVVPGRTACRVCATMGGEGSTPVISGAPGEADSDVLGAMLALETIKAITEYTPSLLAGRASIQDLRTFETEIHMLARMPWCRVCGGAPRAR